VVQRITLEGQSFSVSGDIGIVDNDTLKMFSAGYVYNIEFSFINNVLTTYVASGSIPGLNYASETDVWEKTSSAYSVSDFSIAPAEIDLSDESPSVEVVGEGVIGATIGNLLD